jgi:integrase/recombinase XerD
MHFGGWLQARGLGLSDINEKIVKAFGAHRCKCPGRRSYPGASRRYVARVERFVQYLGQQGVIRSTGNSLPQPPPALIAFREWLLQHRGLAPVTVDRHERLLKQMLPALGADTGQYTVATVGAAVLEQIRGRRPAYAKTFVGALRIYLRFLATSGVCQPGLDHALPTVAEWKLSSLPRYLNSGQAARLCDSCRRDGPLGSRARAIMLLLLRLGLRAGDIANMRPTDMPRIRPRSDRTVFGDQSCGGAAVGRRHGGGDGGGIPELADPSFI